MSADSRPLERVRDELKRLGYLDHGFERFLLQDALKPRRPLRALVGLALKVAILAGTVLALVLAFALAAANGNLARSPFDLLPLFVHLFPPIAATVAVGFLALGALLVGLLRLTHVRRIEAWSLGIALTAGLVTLLLAVWKGPELLAESDPWQLVVVTLAIPLVIFAVVRVLYNGLLSLAISLTDAAPRGRLFRRRWLAVAILGSVFLLVLPGVLAVERPLPVRAPPSIPAATGERVLLVGIDGVLAQELDYLLDRGELPTLARLAGRAPDEPGTPSERGRLARYLRGKEPPAVFWTSVATGLGGSAHGVSALDSFRPLGVTTALARSGPLRDYWSRVAVPLGLAEHRPLLANRRNAFTVWELASRGGNPVLAVGWWSTFPAEPLPGLVVAHGAYSLLGESVADAVAPSDRLGAVEALRDVAESGTGESLAGLPLEASEVDRRALAPDRFARTVFRRHLELQPRMAALYLAAPDLAADGWRWGEVAFADLVRRELAAVDELLAAALPSFGTVAVVVDPGRRGAPGLPDGGSGKTAAGLAHPTRAAEGRVALWRRSGCGPGGGEGAGELPILVPEGIASGMLRALGLPQSEELPPPPTLCSWSSPPSRMASFGQRRQPDAAGRESRQYLESLRSLGYL